MGRRGPRMDVFYHQFMLEDRERKEIFQRVLKDLVRPGDVVADIGAGTGILSVWALRAGASKVYAIEASPMIQLARKMAQDNGLDQIVFLHGDAAKVELPEKVDVIVSECLGAFSFGDAMFRMVGDAARRWLKPGGRRAPQRVRLFLQPADVKTLVGRARFWDTPYDGLDLSAFRPGVDNVVAMTTSAPPFMMGEPVQVADFDPLSRPDTFDLNASWDLPADRTCTSVLGWFEVDWSENVSLDTSPAARPTHWGQAVFPVTVRDTQEGDRLSINLSVELGEDDYPRYRWAGAYEDASGRLVDHYDRDTERLAGLVV